MCPGVCVDSHNVLDVLSRMGSNSEQRASDILSSCVLSYYGIFYEVKMVK